MDFTLQPYEQPARPQGPADWESRKLVIAELYQTVELPQLMKTMEDVHRFRATYGVTSHHSWEHVSNAQQNSEDQYKKHFKKWKLNKNIPTAKMKEISRIRNGREGKGTDFTFRSQHVPPEKIDRFEKRQKSLARPASPPLANSAGMVSLQVHVT